MTRRFKILDGFACGGGAGVGYERAGFEVIGCDIVRHKRNPHPLLLADFLDVPIEMLRMFDAIHVSPPCQGYSVMQHAPGAVGAPKLIAAVRARLTAAGRPFIIENVEGAREDMNAPVCLCGTMFGLGIPGYELRRHRLFETNWGLLAPCPCAHKLPAIGVYGGHVRTRSASTGGRKSGDFKGQDRPALMRQAMGIDWLSMAEMSEAIPPAYTQWVGCQLRTFLERADC